MEKKEEKKVKKTDPAKKETTKKIKKKISVVPYAKNFSEINKFIDFYLIKDNFRNESEVTLKFKNGISLVISAVNPIDNAHIMVLSIRSSFNPPNKKAPKISLNAYGWLTEDGYRFDLRTPKVNDRVGINEKQFIFNDLKNCAEKLVSLDKKTMSDAGIKEFFSKAFASFMKNEVKVVEDQEIGSSSASIDSFEYSLSSSSEESSTEQNELLVRNSEQMFDPLRDWKEEWMENVSKNEEVIENCGFFKSLWREIVSSIRTIFRKRKKSFQIGGFEAEGAVKQLEDLYDEEWNSDEENPEHKEN